MDKLGIIIGSPRVEEFNFGAGLDSPIKKGQLIETRANHNKVIAQITEIKAINEYYGDNSIRYLLNKKNAGIFHDKTVFVGTAIPIAVIDNKDTINPPDIPVIPGKEIYSLSDHRIAEKLFGFIDKGINIGDVMYNKEIQVNLNPNDLFPTHIAIFAQTGGGKTYAVFVILEEFLKKSLSIWDEVLETESSMHFIIIDPHGEYGKIQKSAKELNQIENVSVFKGPFTIPIGDMPGGLPSFFKEIEKNISDPQLRLLEDCWNTMNSSQINTSLDSWNQENLQIDSPTLDMLRSSIRRSSGAKQTKEILQQIMDKYIYNKLIGDIGSINLIECINNNKFLILDFSSVTSYVQQVYLRYALRKIFESRTKGLILPLCIIIEEAHNYAPSMKSNENSISLGIIKNIAREGRKFGVSLCVTSQRPSMLDTTLLSQCGTTIALRTTNDNDLNSISSIAEGFDTNILKRLPPGVALVAGRAVNYPVYVKIKRRITIDDKEKILKKDKILISAKGLDQSRFFGD